MPRSILVVGATGNQGGAVIDNLLQLEADFTILAVTRNTASPSAQKRTQKSSKIKVVQGDLDHPASLFENTKGFEQVWGVCFVQVCPYCRSKLLISTKQSLEPTRQQSYPGTRSTTSKAIRRRMYQSQMSFFVYGSVDRGGDRSFNNRTPVPHFASKCDVEHYLAEKAPMANMDYIFSRPAGFMDNYKPGFQSKMFLTCRKIVLKDKPLQLIAVPDIGYFATQAFLNPQKYKGQAVSLAGDELTFDQATRIFEKTTGQKIPSTFEFVASIVLFLLKDIGATYQWLVEEGFGVDVQELRKSHSGMVDFATYLETQSGYVSKGDK